MLVVVLADLLHEACMHATDSSTTYYVVFESLACITMRAHQDGALHSYVCAHQQVRLDRSQEGSMLEQPPPPPPIELPSPDSTRAAQLLPEGGLLQVFRFSWEARD